MMETIASQFEGKRILILGFGREGVSTYHYLRRHYPTMPLIIADKKSKESFVMDVQTELANDHNLHLQMGSEYLSDIQVDIIIKSPGISVKYPALQSALRNGVEITSQTKLFLAFYHERIVGVTGTKGKSTTASLIAHILTQAGRSVKLLGNIEKPMLDAADEDDTATWYVLELSSYQLDDLTISPHVAVVLNAYRDHLDYHLTFKAYVAAKMNIFRHQSPADFCIYNADDSTFPSAVKESRAQQFSFSGSSHSSRASVHDGAIWFDKTRIINLSSVPLAGKFNLNNVMAASLATTVLGVSSEDIGKGIADFQPLKYRLESIGVYRGIEFYDDALATIPEATTAALDALGGRVETLLAGGFDRGQDYTDFGRAVVAYGVKNLLLFPTTGQRVEKAVKEAAPAGHQIHIQSITTMEEAVRVAYTLTSLGKICLLSAAAPSFSTFIDYKDRSEQYRNWVRRLGEKE